MTRLWHTWFAVRDLRLGLVPQSTHPLYLEAYIRGYCKNFHRGLK